MATVACSTSASCKTSDRDLFRQIKGGAVAPLFFGRYDMDNEADIALTSQGRRRLAWSRYWAEGSLHSLGTSFAGNYADSMGTFWQSEFAPCLPQHHILDIGCGNGPLAKLLVDLVPDQGPSWVGIDLANPSPTWLIKQSDHIRDRIQFRGGVLAEELPFPDHSFDLVVSQFGIEYSDLTRSQAEVVRVLRPEGRIAMLVHHAQSLPVIVSRHELRHLAFIAQTDFLSLVGKMIPFMAQLADPDGQQKLAQNPTAGATRKLFDEAQASLEKRAATEPIPDLLVDVRLYAQECFQIAVSGGAEPALNRLSVYKTLLQDSRLRLDELVRCSLDEAGVLAMQERFASLRGRPARSALVPVVVNDHIFGWTVKA
jgi:ubiquinone/menaquinone biosynthesis C-methylase UbiE